MDFCSGEPFDDDHRSTTLGAMPKMVRDWGVLVDLPLLCCAEELKTKRQESGASPCQETEVADTHEALGE